MTAQGDLGPLVRVRSVEPLDGFAVWLKFADGTEKVIELSQYV